MDRASAKCAACVHDPGNEQQHQLVTFRCSEVSLMGLTDLDVDVLITIGFGKDPATIGSLAKQHTRGELCAPVAAFATLLGGDLPWWPWNHSAIR